MPQRLCTYPECNCPISFPEGYEPSDNQCPMHWRPEPSLFTINLQLFERPPRRGPKSYQFECYAPNHSMSSWASNPYEATTRLIYRFRWKLDYPPYQPKDQFQFQFQGHLSDWTEIHSEPFKRPSREIVKNLSPEFFHHHRQYMPPRYNSVLDERALSYAMAEYLKGNTQPWEEYEQKYRSKLGKLRERAIKRSQKGAY